MQPSIFSIVAKELEPITSLLPDIQPFYSTDFGAAYLGDSLEMLKQIPDGSINAVITSPPYALHFKKEYGNVNKDDYESWSGKTGQVHKW